MMWKLLSGGATVIPGATFIPETRVLTRHPATCSGVASYWCKVCPRKEFSNIKQKCKDSSFQAPKALASRKCYMARDFREARYPFTNKIKASNCIMTEFLLHNYEENRLEFDNMFTTIIIAH